MKLKILFVIFSILFPMSVVHSQSTGTDEVIQRLKEVRERTMDLSADFSRRLFSPGEGRRRGPLSFPGPLSGAE